MCYFILDTKYTANNLRCACMTCNSVFCVKKLYLKVLFNITDYY